MKYSEEILQNAGETVEYARQYTQQQMKYFRLEVAERLSKAMATVVTTAAVVLLITVVMLFLSVSGALYLGALWASYALGFLCVAGIYLVIMILFLIFRRQLVTNPVLSFVLKIILE